jgi:hypothetical protein
MRAGQVEAEAPVKTVWLGAGVVVACGACGQMMCPGDAGVITTWLRVVHPGCCLRGARVE